MASLQADGFRASLWGLVLTTVLLGLWAGWFFLAQVSLYETTLAARLEVNQASHHVQAPLSGRVVKTNLVLDQTVHAGDLLIELETRAEQLQLKEEQSKISAFTSQLDCLHKEIAAEELALKWSRKAGRVALQEAKAKQREMQVAAQLTSEKAKRLTHLHTGGHIAEFDFLEATAKAEQDQAIVGTQRIAIDRLGRNQQTLEGDRQVTLKKLWSEVARIRGQLTVAMATIKRLEHAIEKHRIRAPVAGRLGEITRLVPGAYLGEGSFLAAVVPLGKLKAVASFSPATAMGRIRSGQRARIRLQGFPWTQYGSVSASVARVASETRNGAVQVELDLHPDLNSLIPLQHGLPAEVEVEVERTRPALLVLRVAGKLLTNLASRNSTR